MTNALELARAGRKAVNVKCETDFQSNFWMVGRETEIQQVVLNLAVNAIDAMPQGGSVTVRTKQAIAAGRDWMVIEVQDTGTGIPEELRARIFDPFFTTKDPGKGTGLGLSIVRDIIQTYDGTIHVESTIGHGTTFVVRLPISRLAASVPVAASAAPQAGSVSR